MGLLEYLSKKFSYLFVDYLTIPKSVAVIMDGNRRYAKNLNIEKLKGHSKGFQTMLNLCEWALLLGVKEISVFAFSIDNFNRSKEEIDGLKKLMRDTSKNSFGDIEYYIKRGIKVIIIGKKELIDEDIQEIFHNIETKTKHCDNTEEIERVSSHIQKYEKNCNNNNTSKNFDDNSDINDFNKNNSKINGNNSKTLSNKLKDRSQFKIIEEKENNKLKNSSSYIFEKYLYSGKDICPDILIRTSGEIRLSNFLLYQCRFSQLFFIEKNWPEFSYYDFFKIILQYNFNSKENRKNLKELSEKNDYKINVVY